MTRDTDDQRCRSAGAVVVPTWSGSEILWQYGVADLSPLGVEGRLAWRWVNAMGGVRDSLELFQRQRRLVRHQQCACGTYP